MEPIIYPRSPRETMCGWMHLPRFVDKIRLHLAGKLHPDYQQNFCKAFDQWWMEAAGVDKDSFIKIAEPLQDKLAQGLGPHAVKILQITRSIQ